MIFRKRILYKIGSLIWEFSAPDDRELGGIEETRNLTSAYVDADNDMLTGVTNFQEMNNVFSSIVRKLWRKFL
jgi:hypothetical protein